MSSVPMCSIETGSVVPSVFARSVGKIARAVEPCGKARRLLREVGLEPEAIEDPVLRIPYADMMMLSERAVDITKDDAFGLHVGEQVNQTEYGLVGYAVITSATLEEALRSMVRYVPIWTNVGAFGLDVDGATAIFQWKYARCPLPEVRQDCEMTMAAVARFNRLTKGAEWKPREVWFQHRKPRHTGEHARIFGAPVRFGMPMNALLLHSEALSLRLIHADAWVHEILTTEAERVLAKGYDDGSVSQRVSAFVRDRLGEGDFSLEAASRHFGVGERTLQRRLKEESVSYREVIDRARRELARHLLLSGDATPVEIASALGFCEASVFYRAFQKWYGVTPQAYRRRGIQ
jgi:AraC-like DNA-binding protein